MADVDIWETQDGRKIPMDQMDETHLLNSLAWAKRNNLKKRIAIAEKEYARRFCVVHTDCKANRDLGRSCKEYTSKKEKS